MILLLQPIRSEFSTVDPTTLARLGRSSPRRQIPTVIASPTSFFSGNINLIPMQSAVQVPRSFYGARFFNQAVPLKDPQAALVRNRADDGLSFDEHAGRRSGALFADEDMEILDITPDAIKYRGVDGAEKIKDLYNNFQFNRKTGYHQTSLVEKGQKITAGTPLARSNYTDDKGALTMGRNAIIAVTPYDGYSMDDAVVISQDFAKQLRSVQNYTEKQEYDSDIKGGKKHYMSLFPTEFKKSTLDTMDDEGVVLPGTVLRKDDPIILATKPKTITSGTATLGRLSKAMSQSRQSAAKVWDHEEEGVVTDSARTTSKLTKKRRKKNES